MHLDAATRGTSPVEDRLARKLVSSFRADEAEGEPCRSRVLQGV